MRKRTGTGGQLGFAWTESMRWEDVPHPLQAQVKEILRTVLQCASAEGSQEAGDEQQ